MTEDRVLEILKDAGKTLCADYVRQLEAEIQEWKRKYVESGDLNDDTEAIVRAEEQEIYLELGGSIHEATSLPGLCEILGNEFLLGDEGIEPEVVAAILFVAEAFIPKED